MGYYNLTADSTKSERSILLDVFHAARARGTGNTGIFDLRLLRQSFEYFMHKLRVLLPDHSCDRDRVREVFGRTLFVHLTRQNKIEQAISYVIASQTGLWHKAPNEVELERLSRPRDPLYDNDSIQSQLTELEAMDKGWEPWFEEEGLTPLRITYEDLSAEPFEVAGRLLEELGLNKKLTDGLELPVAKLGDDINKQWAIRFRDDCFGKNA